MNIEINTVPADGAISIIYIIYTYINAFADRVRTKFRSITYMESALQGYY